MVSDNRLAAFESDASVYTFAAPQSGPVTIDVTLLLRRAFIELMDQKGWDTRHADGVDAHRSGVVMAVERLKQTLVVRRR